jgi:hypothetical protein
LNQEVKMASSSSEQTIIDNCFGIVTNKRVTYMAKKGWFGGGRREDVPLRQVVSVRYEIERKVFIGLFLIVLGIVLIAIIVGIIPLFLGVLLIWGSPMVNVVTAGGTASPVIGWPWQKGEAEAFTSSLRTQLFSE